MIFNFKHSAQFRQEIQTWVDEQIISPVQAAQLIAKYELDRESPWYLNSAFWLRGLALLLAGMGLLLLISENWHRFNVPVRMAFGFAPLLVAYVIGFRYEFAGKRDAAELAFFFAGIAFGVNIALQAQIFHISAYYPDGTMWWIIGVLPMAIYFRGSLHHALVQTLFFIWMTQQLAHGQFSFWTIPLYLGMIYLLIRTPNRILFLAQILNTYLFVYNLGSAAGYHAPPDFMLIFIFTTVIVMLATPLFAGQYDKAFLSRLREFGFAIILFFFYLHTFEDVLKENIGDTFSPVVIALAIAAFFWRTSQIKINFAAKVAAFAMLLIYIAGIFFSESKTPVSIVSAVIINLAFFGFAIWSIRHGIQQRQKRFFMSGIFLIILLAVGRYIALFGDYILSAIIFIACGIFIWWINNYWNKRYEQG